MPVYKKKKTIEEYMDIGKWDIVFYAILFTIAFIVALIFTIHFDFTIYLLPWFMFIPLLLFVGLIGRIIAYKHLKEIKFYLEQKNMLGKIGEIYWWNESNLFLTDNYIIIDLPKDIISFSYKEIDNVYEEVSHKLVRNGSSFSPYTESFLNIVLKDGKKYQIQTQMDFDGKECKDISDYLIEKNPNIQKLDTEVFLGNHKL